MKKRNSKGVSLILTIIIILGLLLVGGAAWYIYQISQKPTIAVKPGGKPIVIGFSMGTLQEERWQKDRDEITKQAQAMGVSVDIQGANNDKAKQISQAESMILKGVDVLMIAAYDAASLTQVVTDAHKAGIKVISYDRLITNSDVDYYVSFDNEKVGELEAKSVLDAMKDKLGKGTKLKFAYIGGSTTDNNALLLKKGSFTLLQPLIDNGQIELVVDKFTPDWNPNTAYLNLKEYLDRTNGAIDAVVCANDGTAFGAIKALGEHKLAGVVPVSGQDAELAALQRVVQGTQVATVYKPIPKEIAAALDIAIKIAQGKSVSTNAKVNDGTKDIPSQFVEPILVTKDNIADTVIKDNYHTSAEIYKKMK